MNIKNLILDFLKRKLYISPCPCRSLREPGCTSVTRFLHRITLAATSFAADLREPCCGGHTARTASLVQIIAAEAAKIGYFHDKLDAEYIRRLGLAAPLHDIGKIAVPRAILGKPGKLTPGEFDIVKTHAAAGRAIIEHFITKTGDCGFLSLAAEIAGSHHERWDGSGYPDGLSGEEIPLGARIMAIADVFDALRSRRPYKPAYTFERSLDIIMSESPGQFDPRLCIAFASAFTRLREKNVYKKIMFINVIL